MEKSIGELDGSTSTGVHARCLLCDKIVNKLSNYSTGASKEKASELLEAANESTISMHKGSTSPTSNVIMVNSQPPMSKATATKVKFNAELAILRSSLDLPPIVSTNRIVK